MASAQDTREAGPGSDTSETTGACFAFRDRGRCRFGDRCRFRHERPPLVEQVHALSLGPACFTARFLGDNRRRAYAAPFDWVFSSPEMVCACLEDDFASFVDPDELVPVATATENQQCCGHRRFSAMLGRSVIFNHHNPLNTGGAAHFARAVARFRSLRWRDDGSATAPQLQRKEFFMLSLEHRTPLQDQSLRQLFDDLCSWFHPAAAMTITVVKLFFRDHDQDFAPPAPPPCHNLAWCVEDGPQRMLRVFQFWCSGGLGHAGLFLKSEADTQHLADLVFGGAAPLYPAHLAPDPCGHTLTQPEKGHHQIRKYDDNYLVITPE